MNKNKPNKINNDLPFRNFKVFTSKTPKHPSPTPSHSYSNHSDCLSSEITLKEWLGNESEVGHCRAVLAHSP